ncbi:MAG: hypothetical protein ACE5GZ_13310 [Gammaproteobacteria bacterium]
MPEPVRFERLESIQIKGPVCVRPRTGRRERKPVHSRRFRSKHGLTQPDAHGGFCLPVPAWQTGRMTFDRPIQGPLALGFGCHYGLGMFIPLD